MNGIRISKEEWLKMKQTDRDGALYDRLNDIYILFYKHLRRLYLLGGVIAVLFLVSNPEWAKFIIGKALAAF